MKINVTEVHQEKSFCIDYKAEEGELLCIKVVIYRSGLFRILPRPVMAAKFNMFYLKLVNETDYNENDYNLLNVEISRNRKDLIWSGALRWGCWKFINNPIKADRLYIKARKAKVK